MGLEVCQRIGSLLIPCTQANSFQWTLDYLRLSENAWQCNNDAIGKEDKAALQEQQLLGASCHPEGRVQGNFAAISMVW
jgi:hypothetical protein